MVGGIKQVCIAPLDNKVPAPVDWLSLRGIITQGVPEQMFRNQDCNLVKPIFIISIINYKYFGAIVLMGRAWDVVIIIIKA